LTVLLKNTENCRSEFHVQYVKEVSGHEVPEMAAHLDLRRINFVQKRAAVHQTGALALVQPGAEAEGPEITAFWYEVKFRGFQSGDVWKQGQLVYLEPHSQKPTVAAYILDAKSEETKEMTVNYSELLQTARSTKEKCLIAAPIASNGPKHWTMLCCYRQADELFKVEFIDSLGKPASSARQEGQRLFKLIVGLVGAEQFSTAELPETQNPVLQTDGHSCGLHVCNRLEESYRKFRGEGERRVYRTIEETRQDVNKWVKCLSEFQVTEAEAKKKGKEKKGAETSSASSSGDHETIAKCI
jgi:hypothetical protein